MIKLINSFYPKGRQGDLNLASQARNCRADTKPPPLSPSFFKSPVCLQLRGEARVKTPLARSKGHAIVLKHYIHLKTMAKISLSSHHQVNFKISWASNFGSKIWAKQQAKPNFSSQFLRVSKILKFAKDLYKFVNLFYPKRREMSQILLRRLATSRRIRSHF